MPNPRRFARKPASIEAMQFLDHETGSEILAWAATPMMRVMINSDGLAYRLDIASFDGLTSAKITDWVYKNEDGDFKVIAHDDLANGFDDLEE